MFLVCGEALYDVFPDQGDNPATFNMTARAGGSPFNVAIGLARLGQQSALLTGISTDQLGNRLVQMLESESVNTDYLVRNGRRTTIVIVGVNEQGQPSYAFYGQGSADCSLSNESLPVIGDAVTGLHFGSYSLVMQPIADAFADLMKQMSDRFISIDPNIRPSIQPDMEVWRQRLWEYAEKADLLKISAEDVDYLYPGRDHEEFADALIKAGTQLVVITDGSSDVKCWTQSGLSVTRSPRVGKLVDTVGAGDTFQAALLTRLAQWGEPKQVIRSLSSEQLDELMGFAVTAAAITCSRRGADLPRLDEVLKESKD
ncbi:carbohydrate kinase family protein [Solemya velum gill symbiont]|uniref:Sugar kinase n=3 Tax=Solemya velum gill symbiont TaxID=2340 RepID=A0A0B0HAN2_SOVGS|nr:carbohydrate kinase [Solemya velum gill symbiont]KHF24889.1 sugar kinase [Solemya velum gill symbiont]OOY35013.1 hypothetical protein BOV88_06755 [Solemya velum gill symbiont]OOY37715.1 hypothetical protein BOV89_05665 [Solemya velum gill symbiont]OOY40104.1 hypothetical protein BOV90_05875 [Solemya velum gill symbiont]OOY43638.1 hypothetical protein BOV91_03455 [Solemya velum gill symbiont]